MLERKSIHSIEEVKLATEDVLFNPKKEKINFNGHIIKANSQRYQTFFKSGCNCVQCGINGKFFAMERTLNTNEQYHLNLNAITKDGEEVLMTKDHIVPKSKGGKNSISNYQTMCTKCNNKKGNREEIKL